MTRRLIVPLLALSALACAGNTLGEGPGTRIRSGSQLPRPPIQRPDPAAANACAHLSGKAYERCLWQAARRAPTGTRRDSSSGSSAPR